MAVDVRIPSLGESVSEGVIARWAKKDGEIVRADEVLLELETDKAAMEIPAPESGVVRLLKREGDKVAVGDVVARIEADGGARATTPPVAPAPAPAARPLVPLRPPSVEPAEPNVEA
ncbi:MAG TPA: biotin/lipoyl-containing protein, partial [Gaiellaceae bacterium]|nr:biotin/lipoyl-containing protein [Gaiellaceae bacterium]